MSWDLTHLATEMEAAPLVSPIGEVLAIAIVSDVLRDGQVVPPTGDEWQVLVTGARRAETVRRVDLRREQLGVLAHALSATSLGTLTVSALDAHRPAPVEVMWRLEAFLGAIFPLTGEMMRANRFRREEMLRRWAQSWRAEIGGETVEVSRARLEQIDYRRALVEYERAEQARATEATTRAEALRKAQEAEAAARGWRE